MVVPRLVNLPDPLTRFDVRLSLGEIEVWNFNRKLSDASLQLVGAVEITSPVQLLCIDVVLNLKETSGFQVFLSLCTVIRV